jgi:GR25 family glycosyltransferase involved in LPS biosynthesis
VNSLVDKVFVINLDKDKDRLEKINRALTGQGISYERIPGVLGSQISSDPKLSTLCNWFCTDGIKGCALSHHRAWELMVERGYSRILVFEDDAVIPGNFDEKVRHIMGRLPDDYEIVYLGCRYYCSNTKLTEKFGHHVMDSAPKPFNEEIVKVSGSLGSHATLYTRTAIEKIIHEPITTHIDLQIQQWIRSKKIQTYGVHPEIVGTTPNNLGSNLADTFPPLANKILDTVEITNNTPLGWSMSENFMKLGPFNVNGYIVGVIVLGLFLPWYLSIFLFAWILLETMTSKDIWNGFRFTVFLTTAITLRETSSLFTKGVYGILYPTKKRK